MCPKNPAGTSRGGNSGYDDVLQMGMARIQQKGSQLGADLGLRGWKGGRVASCVFQSQSLYLLFGERDSNELPGDFQGLMIKTTRNVKDDLVSY